MAVLIDKLKFRAQKVVINPFAPLSMRKIATIFPCSELGFVAELL